MPRPSLQDIARYRTTTEVGIALGMDEQRVIRWIDAGLLPPPTVTRETGLRLFSEAWLKEARAMLRCQKTAKG